jgi:hypothetical protein
VTPTYFERVRPTYIEAWPRALSALSIASVDIPLSLGEAEALGSNLMDWGETFPEPRGRPIVSILNRMEDAATRFQGGFVVRLGSRSPKDSWAWNREGPRMVTAYQAMATLCDASERVSDDLHLAIENGYSPHIWFRQWVEIKPWAEFRCFMVDRKLVGVSQYDYLKRPVFADLKADHRSIVWAMDRWFPTFRKACHLDTVVFDVFVTRRTARSPFGEERVFEFRLIEINPAFELTDPCLFSWQEPFDRTFRYLDETGVVKTPLEVLT